MIKWRKIVAVLSCLLLWPVLAGAEMVSFPREVRVGESVLTLRGQGVLRIGFAFRVYQAAFYLGEEHETDAVLDDVPMRLDVNYYRSVSREQLISVADEILGKITAPEELEKIRGRIAQINEWYDAVDRGDIYSLVYLPERGLELSRNGVPLGVVEGHDFARLYLAIWLGDHPHARGMNRKLLGQE